MSVEVMVMHAQSGGPVLSRQQLDELLNDIARGDKAAFEQLYRATCAKLYGIVLRIVRRREVADELLQDIYLRVWKHAGQFDALRSSPITWMATIARNCALDEVKRSALPLSEDDCEFIECVGEDNPIDQYERAEDARRLQVCLGRLGPEKSALVVQAYCFGMSRKDIAKRTGQPVSTVKTWLRRSLAELRSHLEEEKGNDSPAKGSATRNLRGPDQDTRSPENQPWRISSAMEMVMNGKVAQTPDRPQAPQVLSRLQSIHASRAAAFVGVKRQIEIVTLRQSERR